MSKRIVTFGEIMLRLAPNGYYRFFQDDQLQATFGGGEANVAVSLANYGMDAAFVTKLPAHAIGQGAVNALRGLGVDTRSIVRGGDRIGIYFDIGNCLIYAPAQDYVEILGAKYIKAVHIKNWQGDDCGGVLHGFGDSLL